MKAEILVTSMGIFVFCALSFLFLLFLCFKFNSVLHSWHLVFTPAYVLLGFLSIPLAALMLGGSFLPFAVTAGVSASLITLGFSLTNEINYLWTLIPFGLTELVIITKYATCLKERAKFLYQFVCSLLRVSSAVLAIYHPLYHEFYLFPIPLLIWTLIYVAHVCVESPEPYHRFLALIAMLPFMILFSLMVFKMNLSLQVVFIPLWFILVLLLIVAVAMPIIFYFLQSNSFASRHAPTFVTRIPTFMNQKLKQITFTHSNSSLLSSNQTLRENV